MRSIKKSVRIAAITALLVLGGTSSAFASSSTILSGPTAPSVPPIPERLTCKALIKLTQGVFDYAKEMDARGEDSTSMRETGDMLIDMLDEKGCTYAITVSIR